MNKLEFDEKAEREGRAIRQYKLNGLNRPVNTGFRKIPRMTLDMNTLWNEQLRKHK
jgi:hypothetical protein